MVLKLGEFEKCIINNLNSLKFGAGEAQLYRSCEK